jgi:hypothetical protein
MNTMQPSERSVIEQQPSWLRFFFFVWGLLGFVVALLSVVSTWGSSSVGVGTSAYIAMGIEFWIGGMVLFGLGSMLSDMKYISRNAASAADASIPGVASYEVQSDGSVMRCGLRLSPPLWSGHDHNRY